jgi:sugar phosphate isomerase/epimerase
VSTSTDLLITGSTLGNPPFREMVEAASAGGFAGLSLWPAESWSKALAAGSDAADMERMLEDNGVVVNDVDALVRHVGRNRGVAEPAEQLMFDAGEALGAGLLNMVIMGPQPTDLDEMAEIFADVFDRAAEHGLTTHLEFVPFMAVPDATTAWQVVERSGRPGGVMVDSWHCFRGPTTWADLRAIPGERVIGVQINDAPSEPVVDNQVVETLHHRLLPGEGDIDLVGLLGVLGSMGSPAPLTAEVFSDALLAEGTPREIAIKVGDSMRALVSRAKSASSADVQEGSV